MAPDSTPDQVKACYRKLAMKHHPDRSRDPGATEKFKEIQQSYEAIKAIQSRSSASIKNANPTKNQTQTKTPKPPDIRNAKPVKVSLKTLITGGEIEIKSTKITKCQVCRGLGKVLVKSRCSHCNTNEEWRSFFNFVTPCNVCNSKGVLFKPSVCKNCKGKGLIREDRVLKLKIPSGTPNESVFRLSDDYFPSDFKIFALPTKTIQIIKNNIYIAKTIQASQIGKTVLVRCHTKAWHLKIPSAVRNGSTIRLFGAGLANNSQPHGDVFVRVNIKEQAQR